MVVLSKDAAVKEGTTRHPVPSLQARRDLAPTIVKLLTDCSEDSGGCLPCLVLDNCTRFYDSHYTHDMEIE